MAQEEDLKYFVRVGTTDLDGTKSVRIALTGIMGVGRHTSTVISRMAKVDEYAQLVALTRSRLTGSAPLLNNTHRRSHHGWRTGQKMCIPARQSTC